MSYKMAVASSDGFSINSHFGATREYRIYEVENEEADLVEVRTITAADEDKTDAIACDDNNSCGAPSGVSASCAGKKSCGGGGGGCGNDPVIAARIDVINDCRCVLAGKIGFQIQKQLEKRGIAHFELDCEIQDAFDKLIPYFYKVDNHLTLRNFAKEN